MNDELSLLEEFLEESREHLSRMEQDFLELEKGDQNPELINRIFRAVHTVKGSSGFFGLVRIGSISHAMESVLDGLREGNLETTPKMLDLLLEGLDQLRILFSDLEHSNEVDTWDLEERLRDLCAHHAKSTAPVLTFEPQESEVSAETAAVTPTGHHLYRLNFDITQMERERSMSPVQLVEHLLSFGEIHDGRLETRDNLGLSEGLPTGLLYRILFSSVLDRDLVAHAINLPEEAVEEIGREGTLGSERGPADASAPESREPHSSIPLPPAPPEDFVSSLSSNSSPGSASEFPRESTFEATAREEPPAPRPEQEYIKVRLDILDRLMSLAGELVLVRNQQMLRQRPEDTEGRRVVQQLDLVASELQETILRTRMQPIGSVFSRFSRVVRDLSRKLGKSIQVKTSGDEAELDKNILEALIDPLTHIVRNSCDHGLEIPEERRRTGKPEIGTIELKAWHEGGHIHVEVQDDGRGVDRARVRQKVLEKGLRSAEEMAALSESEVLAMIFLPGFSTAATVSDMSGRGVGMDVVKSSVEALGGMVEIHSEAGAGMTLHMRLPLTLAIIPSMIVQSMDQAFAIPQINLEELVTLYDEEILARIESAGAREVFRLRGMLLPLIHLSEVLRTSEPLDEEARQKSVEQHRQDRLTHWARLQEERSNGHSSSWSLSFAVLKIGNSRYGLVLEKLLGTEEIVVKPMHRAIKDIPLYSGATVLGDGQVALILDVQGIARHFGTPLESRSQRIETEQATAGQRLLVFRNGPQEQLALPLESIGRIEEIAPEQIERVGNHEFIALQGVSTRIQRLEDCLEISTPPASHRHYAILPRRSEHPWCMLAQELVDIGEYSFELDQHSVSHPSLLGTMRIRDHLTLLIDPQALAPESTEHPMENP